MTSPAPVPASLSAILARLELAVLSKQQASVHLQATLEHCAIVPASASTPLARFSWRDVLGASLRSSTGAKIQTASANASSYVLHLAVCTIVVPKKAKNQGNAHERSLHVHKLHVKPSAFDDAVIVCNWINFLADPRNLDVIQAASNVDKLVLAPRAPREFLVLVNPASGKGKAHKVFNKKIAPILDAAQIHAKVQLTERPQHGKEIAMALPLGQFDCVVAVGGDGTLSEITQGFMEREDWQEAIKQPIGVVPGGSGNGLAATVLYGVNEKIDAVNAAYVLAKGVPQALDLAAVRNPYGEMMYSFLSVAWAAVADIDIESEALRYLGGLRFAVLLLWKVYCSRKLYPGTIWYLDDGDVDRSAETLDSDEKLTAKPGFDLIDDLEKQNFEPTAKAIGAQWKKLESDFMLHWSMNVTHATTDSNVAPMAKLDDGYNYMVYIDTKNHEKRKAMLHLMLDATEGKHLERPACQLIKSRAFKIVPKDKEDRISVDGELFRGPIDIQVHPRLARLIGLPPQTTSA